MTSPLEALVPEGTGGLRPKIIIGAVVRLNRPILNHTEATRAVVVSADDRWINDLELLVPGYPVKFWMPSETVTVLEAPRQDWWALLKGEESSDPA